VLVPFHYVFSHIPPCPATTTTINNRTSLRDRGLLREQEAEHLVHEIVQQIENVWTTHGRLDKYPDEFSPEREEQSLQGEMIRRRHIIDKKEILTAASTDDETINGSPPQSPV
jgi:hypothetical protein